MTGMCRGIAGPVHTHIHLYIFGTYMHTKVDGQIQTVRRLLGRHKSSVCVSGVQTKGSFIVKRQPQGNERKLPSSKITNVFCFVLFLMFLCLKPSSI